MIELKVEDYCHGCVAFDPVADINKAGPFPTFDNPEPEPVFVNTVVKCKNAKRCAGIARHISKELSKKCVSSE